MSKPSFASFAQDAPLDEEVAELLRDALQDAQRAVAGITTALRGGGANSGDRALEDLEGAVRNLQRGMGLYPRR